MSNATSTEMYESARSRIVNSTLGQALGLTEDTPILSAAVSIEGVEVGATTQVDSYNLDESNNRLRFYIPKNAYYKTSHYLYQTYANIASLIGLTSAKLIKGNTILGVTGTAEMQRVLVQSAAESHNDQTFDIAAIDTNYANYTVDNFSIVVKTKATGTFAPACGNTDKVLSFNGTMTYTASTGSLTVPYFCAGNYSSGNKAWTAYYYTYDVLLHRMKTN